MTTAESTTLHIENIDHFIQLLAAWHDRKLQILEHMLTIPVGTPVSLDGAAEEPLSGDLHRGFLLGMHVALSELGTLPFAFEEDEDEEDEETAPADAVAA